MSLFLVEVKVQVKIKSGRGPGDIQFIHFIDREIQFQIQNIQAAVVPLVSFRDQRRRFFYGREYGIFLAAASIAARSLRNAL
jgi:hypothetical protein